MKTGMEVLNALAERWDETPEWHNPPFHDGEIHITTGDLHAISNFVKESRKTGLKYSDGTPICEGDIVVFWHNIESQKKLYPYRRQVEWNDDMGAYISVNMEGGRGNFLYNDAYDPNCQKVTKA
jgi:hypothetical protein